MNKRFIFPCNIRLGNIGLIYHGSVSEDKLVHELQIFLNPIKGIEQAGIL